MLTGLACFRWWWSFCLLLIAVSAQPSWLSAQQPNLDAQFQWQEAETLHTGIEHLTIKLTEPRRMVIHCVRVDTTTPNLTYHTTGRITQWRSGEKETRRQTVRDFIRDARARGVPVVVAINGDSFSPWPAPYAAQDPTDLNGLAVSEGTLVSPAVGTPSLIITKDGSLRIDKLTEDADLSNIQLAISGFALCLSQGQAQPSGRDLHPRTGFGLSQDGTQLFLMTIDGRQPESRGATVPELGHLLLKAGAFTGINMDGGGSTTLAVWRQSPEEDQPCKLLNLPVGSGKSYTDGAEPLSPTERANGNNFGIAVP
jgi:hypothetical protein